MLRIVTVVALVLAMAGCFSPPDDGREEEYNARQQQVYDESVSTSDDIDAYGNAKDEYATDDLYNDEVTDESYENEEYENKDYESGSSNSSPIYKNIPQQGNKTIMRQF